MALSFTQIVETFNDLQGNPLSGTAVFQVNTTVYAAGIPVLDAGVPIQAQIVSGALKNSSGGTLQLLDQASTGLTYVGQTSFFFYTVTVTVGGQVLPSWSFFLQHSSTPVDLYSLANTAAGGFTSPMTTLGDMISGGASGAAARLAGNTTSVREFLTSQGSGGAATAPAWSALQAGDIPQLADYAPTGLTGATAASRYVGATASGAPASGTFAVGDFVADQTGKFWLCTVAGTPGTWVQIGGSSLPLTTLGDLLYENATPAAARLAGNTTTTRKFLRQVGDGTNSAAPAWDTLQAGDLPGATTSAQGAVVLDGTAADIQPDGTQAQGATGKAADAGHVHPFQPWQFRPESYGAKGDGKVLGDVSVTASSAVITSASANFTAGDVGKYIMIHGANGATSGPLITTVASRQSATQVTLAAAASATVSNCPAVYGTDDTAAINSALTAAGNYATANNYFAEVLFGAKVYILGTGPTQTGNGTTTPTFNAQITLPYPNANGITQKMVIALTGAGDAGFCQYWESLVPNLAGTCLVSMTTAPSSPSGTFGVQSVIGGPTGGAGNGAAPGFTGGFANVKAVIKGISVWCSIYTNQYAFDLGYVSGMRVQQSSAHIFAPTGVNGGVQPYLNAISATAFLNSIGSGFRTPVTTNNADVVMDDCTAEGYECGFRVFDHFTAGRLAAIYSDVAMFFNGSQGASGTSHEISVLQMCAEVYNGGFLANGGTAQVDISWDAECSSVAYDVSDSANGLRGLLRFRDPANARFPAVTNAANLKVICDQLGPGYWSGAPAVPSSTTAQQNTSWRDAWVTITGGTVSAIAVDGQATGFTLSTGQVVSVRVPGGKNITLTYSVAPTWKWWLD